MLTETGNSEEDLPNADAFRRMDWVESVDIGP